MSTYRGEKNQYQVASQSSMSEDFKFPLWMRIANRIGFAGWFALFGIIGAGLTYIVYAIVAYAVVKFIVAH